MRRLSALVFVVLLLPTTALAAELDELLDASKDAGYSAEQLITCNTPDGVRDVLIELEQRGGEIRYGNRGQANPDIWSGHGGWSGPSGGSTIEPGTSDSSTAGASTAVYVLDDGESAQYLGREATRYVMASGDLERAELVVDNELGVFLSVTTFDNLGDVYCDRRFISFDPTPPEWAQSPSADGESIDPTTDTALPDQLAGFALVDVYSDESGLSFAYYSDGFFSFAVFQSPIRIASDEASAVEIEGASYQREFAPGQVTYTWSVGDGGMAMIGDLPPDMHEAVLAGLERPREPGFFNRLWRSIFG